MTVLRGGRRRKEMSIEPETKLFKSASARKNEGRVLSPLAFPMVVLFGTYLVWLALAGIVLFLLNVF